LFTLNAETRPPTQQKEGWGRALKPLLALGTQCGCNDLKPVQAGVRSKRTVHRSAKRTVYPAA